MSQGYEFIGAAADGKRVVFDPVSSHAATHFRDAPGLRELVVEVLGGLQLDEPVIANDIDMGRVIGNTDVVDIDETDELVYAIRDLRADQGYVPFTKSRPAQPSSFVSLYLIRKDDDTYELSSAWIGEYDSPLFPQMEAATTDSVPYWKTHAFVWGSQAIEPGSVLNDCPW